MVKRRKDSKGVVLKDGEYQRSNGTYEFKWQDKIGRRKSIYAKTLKEFKRKGIRYFTQYYRWNQQRRK